MDCRRCGTCCTAPDIAALRKPLGVRCRHLTDVGSCAIYDSRPAVCRKYRPDELCIMISAPDLEERTSRYLRIFGMEQQAGTSGGKTFQGD